MRARTVWLSASEKALIIDEALHLLHRVGMRMSGSRSLDALATAGAEVDAGSGVVRFPPEMVRAAVALCPREFTMAGASPELDVRIAEGEPSRLCSSGCAAFVLDDETLVRRPSTLEDLRRATALLDASPEVDVIWTTVTANDVPLEERELAGYFAVLTESDKHVTFVDCPSQVEPLLRIAEIVPGGPEAFRARPRFSTLLTAASPLQIGRAAPRLPRRARGGRRPGRGLHRAHGGRDGAGHRGRDDHAGCRRVPWCRDVHADGDALCPAAVRRLRLDDGHAFRRRARTARRRPA